MNLFHEVIMVFGLLLCSTTCVNSQSKPIDNETNNSRDIVTIRVNKNIEFLGYVLHIGEPEEKPSQAARSHQLRQVLDERRSRFRNEESLIKAFDLGAELPYGFFVELFARMPEFPYEGKYEIPKDILLNHQLNTPADVALVNEVMDQINIFYRVSEFDLFWESSQVWYTKALEEVYKVKPNDQLIKTMETFYEQKFLSYIIIPSLTFWSGPGFAFKEVQDKGAEAFFVLGPLTDDYHFDLDGRFKTFAIHEFGHSFANHELEATCLDLIGETELLFDPIAETMSAQGYPNWSYCVNEHFVRAGEVLIPQLMNDKTISESNLKWNIEEKEFIYLNFVVNQLRSYRIEKGFSYKQSIRKTMSDLKKEFMP